MLKLKIKNPNNAQAMVEFALVLPVFLLLILGLFMIGHYLFTFSFVLSASREAARYGSAVGRNGSGTFLFQDCDGIIAAAMRVGNYAGVNPSNITITYDDGPGETPYGTCPPGGLGPNVDLGDRIVVEIAVPYEMIVPMPYFPDIVVRASTARTIVRDVSVGQALDMDDHCIDTTTSLQFTYPNPTGPNPAVVGQPVTFKALVDADSDDGLISAEPVQVLDIEYIEFEVVEDGETTTKVETKEIEMCSTPGTQNGVCTAQFFEAGTRSITARFIGLAGDPCFNPSEHFNYELEIKPASTQTKITNHDPNPSKSEWAVLVEFDVDVVAPGAGTPTGSVTVTGGESTCTGAIGPDGTGSCVIYPKRPSNGKPISITANYLGDGNYLPSSDTVTHTVDVADEPPPIIPPPDDPPYVPVCPVVASTMSFNTDGKKVHELIFKVRNDDPNVNFELKSVQITWPTTPLAKLQQIRFGVTTTDDCNKQGHRCVYGSKNNEGVSPPDQTLDASNPLWDASRALINVNTTHDVRMVFSSSLPSGDYHVNMVFQHEDTVCPPLPISGSKQ